MTRRMMRPSAHVVRTYGIPSAVVAEAFTHSPIHRAFVMDSLASLRALCAEIGLVTDWTRPVWRRLGIWGQSVGA